MQKLMIKMKNLKYQQWSFILLLLICIAAMIYKDATSSYDDVWLIETGFSFSNMRPLSWIIPIFVWITVFYPIIKIAGLSAYKCRQIFSYFPTKWMSLLWGILATIFYVFVISSLINCTILCPIKEYDLRDIPFIQFYLLFMGIMQCSINRSYLRDLNIILEEMKPTSNRTK